MPRYAVAVAALAVVLLSLPRAAHALGEPVNGFPSWGERVIHEWTNRARCDPQVEMAACGAACADAACYGPVAPLAWSDAAARAARFHATEMARQGFFAHDSACTLVADIGSTYPGSCDASASCACQGGTSTCSGTCTTSSARLALFGASAGGENIAWTSVTSGDPSAAFYLWLHETTSSATCGFSAANGHRWNILQTASAAQGTGMFALGGAGTYSVVDFTSGGATGKIASGAHYPQQGPSVEAWANWYDPAGAPSTALIDVDGVCTTMALARGSDTNGAWRAVLTGYGTGCHRYYFAFQDSAAAWVTYPTTGSFGIGPAGTCADWDATRPALGASCLTMGLPADPPAAPSIPTSPDGGGCNCGTGSGALSALALAAFVLARRRPRPLMPATPRPARSSRRPSGA
jgi:uncharacterized protein (TIGR03382 family)